MGLILFSDLKPTKASPERVKQFKLQKSCSLFELLEFSLDQVIDIASEPSREPREPFQTMHLKWLHGDDWKDYVDEQD